MRPGDWFRCDFPPHTPHSADQSGFGIISNLVSATANDDDALEPKFHSDRFHVRRVVPFTRTIGTFCYDFSRRVFSDFVKWWKQRQRLLSLVHNLTLRSPFLSIFHSEHGVSFTLNLDAHVLFNKSEKIEQKNGRKTEIVLSQWRCVSFCNWNESSCCRSYLV